MCTQTIFKSGRIPRLHIRRNPIKRTYSLEPNTSNEVLKKEFTNNTALITGGSKGLGLDIAKRFAEYGAKVIITSRNEERLKRSVKELDDISIRNNYQNLKHDFISCDLSDETGIQDVVKNSKLRDVNILINCAGIMQTNLLMRTKYDEIKSMVSLNLTAPIILSQRISKFMITKSREKKIKSIINISSALAKKHSLPGTTVYSASKCGLIAFTKSFATEVGRYGIRVNAISPGLIRGSEISGYSNIKERFVQDSVLEGEEQDLVEPEEIVESVVFLLKSKNITGENITIDNGYSL